jgi:predicted lysophospholipase L1 biosynthesis ABC-type transport system permease subunit
MPPKKRLGYNKSKAAQTKAKILKKIQTVVSNQNSNLYYTDLARKKDKDYNTKLELMRLDTAQVTPFIRARILELKNKK